MSIVEADVFNILTKMENQYITPAFIAEQLGYGKDAEEKIRAFVDPLCRFPSYGPGQYRIDSVQVLDKESKKITAYRYEDTALEFLG